MINLHADNHLLARIMQKIESELFFPLYIYIYYYYYYYIIKGSLII